MAWAGRIGLWTLALVALACFGSLPWTLARVDGGTGAPIRRYEASNLSLSLLPPSWWAEAPLRTDATASSIDQYEPTLVLGTDAFGRDVLARCLLGGAISLLVGLSAAAVTVVLGTLYGAVSASAGGRTDALMMRLVDIIFGLPSILLVVLLAVAFEGLAERLEWHPGDAGLRLTNVLLLLLTIGGVSWLTMARVIRGQVLSLRQQPFMEACRAMGASPWRQFRLHLLPNIAGPVIVYATLAVPAAILSESFLSYLGIGIREPLPSWGNLAADGLGELNMVVGRWWLLLWPCLMIALTLVALNLLGDELRQRLDPLRSRTAGC